MLKRIKRAGIWMLTLAMAVTMTPAAAFANSAEVPSGAEDFTYQDRMVQTEDDVAEAFLAGSDVKKAVKEVEKIDAEKGPGVGPDVTPGQEKNLGKIFGIEKRTSIMKEALMAYGEIRSFGDSWKTGPALQPAEDHEVDEDAIVREYAYFRNMEALLEAVKQENKPKPPRPDVDDESVAIAYESSAAGMDDPGFVLERISWRPAVAEEVDAQDAAKRPGPKEEPVYAVHLTAVDVTVTADDAFKVASGRSVNPTFTVTETFGDYPEALDETMEDMKGLFGSLVVVELEEGASDALGTYKLNPVLRDDVIGWDRPHEEMISVLWFDIVNHVDASESQNEIFDLVNPGLMMIGPLVPAEPVLKVRSEETAERAEAIREIAELKDVPEAALDRIPEADVIDFSEIYDPPIHLELVPGTFTIEDETPLPAPQGRVAKQVEATQLDGQYKTTVKMTLPLTDGIDPAEFYRHRNGIDFGPQPIDFEPFPGEILRDERSTMTAKSVDNIKAAGLGEYYDYNAETFPKQNETIVPGAAVVIDLSSEFDLPVDGNGNLDLATLKIVDYEYLGGKEEAVQATSDSTYSQWMLDNVFNTVPTTDSRGYEVYDLKGYRLDNPYDGFENELGEDGDAAAIELFGFGLLRDGPALTPTAEADGPEYYPWDFEFLVIYLPEGISGIPEDITFGYPYDTAALEEPCMIVAYQGFHGDMNLDPLHYFTFQYEETYNNVSTVPGTYGTYDRYGERELPEIQVYDKATLYRMSMQRWGPINPPIKEPVMECKSLNEKVIFIPSQEKPELFYTPTVSYTVNGNNGGGGNGGGRTSGGNTATILEPEVPLAELPELNKVDHVAYIIGYEDGTVRPENYITRAEVSTIFFRLLTDDSRQAIWSSTNGYSDAAATAWYNNAVSTLSNGGVLSGYTDGTFKPGGNITRAEFATIAARFDESAVDTANISFTDISGHWAENNVKRAAALGYITGYQDGSFKPNEPITRAEAMTLMNRVLGRDKIHADGLLDNMAKWSDNPPGAWYYVAVQEATNTHDYLIEGGVETWTSILVNRDWAALEKEWATGAERGAEVVVSEPEAEAEEPAAEAEEPAAEESSAEAEAEASK